jgi:DNA-binding CsgD family transcriptional regulator
MSLALVSIEERFDAHMSRLAELRSVEVQLRASADVPALLAAGTAAAVDFCRFDRGVLVALVGGRLEAADSDALADPANDRLRRQLQQGVVELAPGTLEDALVSGAATTDVASDLPSGLAERLGLGEFAIEPVRLETRPVALLVLDRETAPVDALDRALITGFSLTLGMVLEHRIQRARLTEIAAELRHVSAFTQALMGETISAPLGLPRRQSGGLSFPLVEAVQPPVSRPWDHLLTAQARNVAASLRRGLSNRQIAEELVISVDTVKSHVARILRKLGAENRGHAIARMLGNPGPEPSAKESP